MGEKFRFNNLQRTVLVGAAALIAVVLWTQVDDVGLDETPWLWGVLVILALILLALRSDSSTLPMSAAATRVDRPQVAAEELKAEYLQAAERLGDFIRAKLLTLPHTLPVQFLGQTGGYIDGVALRGAFALTLLRREKCYKGYTETDAVMELRKLAVGHLANSKMQDLRDTADGPPKRPDMIKQAAAETVQYEMAVRQVLRNKALAEPFALEPVFLLLDRELPLSDGKC